MMEHKIKEAMESNDINEVKRVLRGIILDFSELHLGGNLFEWNQCMFCGETSGGEWDSPRHTVECHEFLASLRKE